MKKGGGGMDEMAGNERIVCVVGPTASGKSALAVSLAERFGGEVVSFDSMQVYRGMNIGTAKSTDREMRGIPLHLTDVADIHEPFSVSDYVERAEDVTRMLWERRKLPVFCGGTGLYIDAFLSGVRFADYEDDPACREALRDFANENGADALFERLEKVDPEAAKGIPRQNVKRVTRALEVYELTGKTFTEWNKESLLAAKPKKALCIGLRFAEREKLYERINDRVDGMIKAGLVGETEKLIRRGLRETPTAGQAIGYKEFYPYFDGQATLDDCAETLKKNTRHYAKRQMTWFARNKNIRWLDVDVLSPEALTETAARLTEDYLCGRLAEGVTLTDEGE